MIISPTVETFALLQPTADYTIILPEPTISLSAPKNISVTRTVSGGATVTIWKSSMAGEKRSVSPVISQEKYERLVKIIDTGFDEWIVRTQGKTFTAIIDVLSAVKSGQSGQWLIELVFVVTGDEKK